MMCPHCLSLSCSSYAFLFILPVPLYAFPSSALLMSSLHASTSCVHLIPAETRIVSLIRMMLFQRLVVNLGQVLSGLSSSMTRSRRLASTLVRRVGGTDGWDALSLLHCARFIISTRLSVDFGCHGRLIGQVLRLLQTHP